MKRTSLIAAVLLAGCTVGPDYRPQDITTPNSYSELPATADEVPLSAPVADEGDLSQWWLQFGDAELQKLIARALQSNLGLLAAASRVREAREQEIIAGAAGVPQIDARGLTAGAHSSANLLSKFGDGSSTPSKNGPLNLGLFSAGFDATWEVDLFGGSRRGLEATQASTDAAVWRMRDGEVALTAEIATDYIALRATQEHIAILRAETQAQQDLLHMIKARAGVGFATQLDVNQQSSLADSTVAQIPELEGDVRALEHAIAVLLAQQPEAMMAELDSSVAIPAMPSSLPVGLPSDLLRRRPDIRAAERELGAATAQVGVAISDLYPKFDLIGAVASTAGVGALTSGGNLGEFGLGSITWPVFHWDQSHANIRAKEEEAKQAYFSYQKAVLGAVQNVEDALARYTTEQQRLVALERAETTVKSSTAIATQQFLAGTVTYVNVVVAQADELSVRAQLVQSQQVFATDLISLYKALGGGWVADAGGDLASRDNQIMDAMASRPFNTDGWPPLRLGLSPNRANSVRNDSNGIAPSKGDVRTVESSSSIFPAKQDNIALHQLQSLAAGPGALSNPRPENKLNGPQLQLGAWHNEAMAMGGWTRATRQAGDLLKGLMPHIVAADLPGKGRYYRLRTELTSSADPIKLCQALTAKGLACILVRD